MALAAQTGALLFALLRYSIAQTTTTPPEWYAANIINDSTFSPKPLSEIFSTQETFSTVNPIVVLPSSTQASSAPNQPTVTVPPTPVTSTFSPSSSASSSELPPSTSIAFQVPSQSQPQFPMQIFGQAQSTPQQPSSVPPNYFVFYQQAPQNVQNNPQQLPVNQLSTTQAPCVTSTLTSASSLSSITPTSLSTSPTPNAPRRPTNSSQSPIPYIRIRMLSPGGTITNVNVNPPSTTRKPTTTRRNRRRNNYDGCVNSCAERRSPVCAAPLGSTPINPDNLKGFPSICHMACHNSFRKNSYEKVVDGRCGRLRNRIRTVDSNNKLTRQELNKAQYTIVNNPSTIIEFSPLTP